MIISKIRNLIQAYQKSQSVFWLVVRAAVRTLFVVGVVWSIILFVTLIVILSLWLWK